MWTGRRLGGLVVATALVASGCDLLLAVGVNGSREDASVPTVDFESQFYLDEVAAERANQLCAGGLVGSADDAYGGETARRIAELAGIAALDPAVTEPLQRRVLATNSIFEGWIGDPAIVDAELDVGGISTVDCGDGTLAGVLAMRDEPTMPGAGRFSSEIYSNAQLTEVLDVKYGTAVDYLGSDVDLLIDLYLPPAGGPSLRPAVVMVHGGGFSRGTKERRTNDAKAYARRGFVGATISYRLRPNSTTAQQIAAALDAIDDAMESVRWLKANAATYGVDTGRIAYAGTSAGGAISLGVAVHDDPTPGGPLSAHSPEIAAAVSTGAHLTPGLSLIVLGPADAPVMLFYFEQDTYRDGTPWTVAYETCTAVRDSANVCDFIRQPGEGHTTNVGAQGQWWSPEIGPFLWHHLDLAPIA